MTVCHWFLDIIRQDPIVSSRLIDAIADNAIVSENAYLAVAMLHIFHPPPYSLSPSQEPGSLLEDFASAKTQGRSHSISRIVAVSQERTKPPPYKPKP